MKDLSTTSTKLAGLKPNHINDGKIVHGGTIILKDDTTAGTLVFEIAVEELNKCTGIVLSAKSAQHVLINVMNPKQLLDEFKVAFRKTKQYQ